MLAGPRKIRKKIIKLLANINESITKVILFLNLTLSFENWKVFMPTLRCLEYHNDLCIRFLIAKLI